VSPATPRNASDRPTPSDHDPTAPRIRDLLLAYAFAAVMTTLQPVLAGTTTAGAILGAGGLLALSVAAVGLGVTWRRRRGRDRGAAIALAAVATVVHVAASAFVTLHLLAALVASALLVGLRPQFPRLSRRARTWWLVAHVGTTGAWLGAAATGIVMNVTAMGTDDAALRASLYAFKHTYDLGVIIPVVLASIITGLVLSFGTKWGLIRHWWVLAKFVISLGIVSFAGSVESVWVLEVTDATRRNPDAELGGTDVALVTTAAAFTILLWAAMVLSIAKPWGRTRWGRRAAAREAADARSRASDGRRRDERQRA
jgi:hypothetical protein